MKKANIFLISKPGKDKTLRNLRRIALELCLGKLFETVVHTKLTEYMASEKYLPHNVYRFRQHLSTQDIFLRIKDEVIQWETLTQI